MDKSGAIEVLRRFPMGGGNRHAKFHIEGSTCDRGRVRFPVRSSRLFAPSGLILYSPN